MTPNEAAALAPLDPLHNALDIDIPAEFDRRHATNAAYHPTERPLLVEVARDFATTTCDLTLSAAQLAHMTPGAIADLIAHGHHTAIVSAGNVSAAARKTNTPEALSTLIAQRRLDKHSAIIAGQMHAREGSAAPKQRHTSLSRIEYQVAAERLDAKCLDVGIPKLKGALRTEAIRLTLAQQSVDIHAEALGRQASTRDAAKTLSIDLGHPQ